MARKSDHTDIMAAVLATKLDPNAHLLEDLQSPVTRAHETRREILRREMLEHSYQPGRIIAAAMLVFLRSWMATNLRVAWLRMRKHVNLLVIFVMPPDP